MHYTVSGTYDGRSLESRCSAIEHKHWLDAVEQQLADTAQETDHMCVNETAALLVAHRGLELVYPYTGVYRHGFSLHGLKSTEIFQPLRCLEQYADTYGTGRPTGSRRVHSDLTPMAQTSFHEGGVDGGVLREMKGPAAGKRLISFGEDEEQVQAS